ncbi:ankyrin repeat domain-containing protein [Neolewinella sp.]|uniref:ankyrin repeat domain-containing protein n=1 Tax=Neolewinella sp. TaxID=2993543 RepID=UPI003B523AB2
MIERILSPTLVDALGWTLLHALWQGAAFALLLGLLLIALRSYSARARYIVSVGVLGAFLLTAGASFLQLYTSSSRAADAGAKATVPVPQSISTEATSEATTTYPAGDKTKEQTATTVPFRERAVDYFDRHLPLIVTIWLLGVLVLQLRLLGRLAFTQRLRHYGSRSFPAEWAEKLRELEDHLRIRRTVQYLQSDRVTSPLTLGWLRPAVLFPTDLLDQLSRADAVAILAHELAHVRRHDFAVNLLQTFLTLFFFYHPAVWWMNQRIAEEREHCCDDLALVATQGRGIDYARTLVRLREVALLPQPALAMKAGGAGGLLLRVRRAVNGRIREASFGEGVVTTVILIGALALGASATATTRPDVPQIEAANQLAVDSMITARELGPDSVGTTPPTIDAGPPLTLAPATPPSAPRQAPSTGTDDSLFYLLMQAVYDEETAFARHLIPQVTNLDRSLDDRRNFSPLMAAASENLYDIAYLLLEAGADPNYTNRDGWTALTEAADEGSYEVAQLLLQRGARADQRSNDAPTPLIMAASEGHLDVLELLLTEGADPLAAEGYGRTAFTAAAEEGHVHIIERLLELDVEQDLSAAIEIAALEGNVEIIQLLTPRLAGQAMDGLVYEPDHLVGAAHERQFAVARMLVIQGADVNAATEDGTTPLAAAAAEHAYDVAELLLDQDARVDYAPAGHCTPLAYAAREGDARMIELLHGRGAELTATCSYDDTHLENGRVSRAVYRDAPVLLITVNENSQRATEALISLGADPNATGSFQYERHADRVNDWDDYGELDPAGWQTLLETRRWTPLMEAILTGEGRLLQLLIDAGADPKATLEDGTTLSDLARRFDKQHLLPYLTD